MARQTSIDVYREIEANGLLSLLRWKVYRWLFHNGPATSFEIAKGIEADHKSTSPRMVELVDRGVVREVGKKECSASFQKHTSIAWDVTPHLPTNPPRERKLSRKQLLARIASLEAEVVRLKTGRRKKYDDSQIGLFE